MSYKYNSILLVFIKINFGDGKTETQHLPHSAYILFVSSLHDFHKESRTRKACILKYKKDSIFNGKL